MLELAQLVDQVWSNKDSGLLAYSLALLNNVAFNVNEFAKSQIEWMSEKLMKQMGDRKANPLQFKHLKLCHYSMAGVNKVVLASMPMPYMECGFARDLFLPMVLQPQKLLHPRLQGVVRAAWRETSRQGVRCQSSKFCPGTDYWD